MATKSKKEKLAEKKAKMNAKMAAKKKKIGKAAKVVAVLALVLAVTGCFTDPKSRANQSEVGDQKPAVTVSIGEGACNNTLNFRMPTTVGDVGYQAADSAGSTETQTATPTWTFPIKVDARYNDAIAALNSTSRSVFSNIGSGAGAILDMLVSGKSGTVNVTKSDGTAAAVKCENGQCSICEDGECGDK